MLLPSPELAVVSVVKGVAVSPAVATGTTVAANCGGSDAGAPVAAVAASPAAAAGIAAGAGGSAPGGPGAA
ncbi:MAG: hypothetical protein WBC17_02620, partial [Mycobacterium sp.]